MTTLPLLVTGFEPFGTDERNASADVAGMVASLTNAEVVVLPTTFAGGFDAAHAAVGGVWPPLVIALGQAAGRPGITVERFAVNREDCGDTPANDGDAPRGRPVETGAPAALAVTIDVDAAVAAARDVGVPAAASLSAGTHCCNALLYRLLRATTPPRTRVGFVHLPVLPGQRPDGATPTMDGPLQARGVAAIIAALQR